MDANRDLPGVRVPVERLAADAALGAASETLVDDTAERCDLTPIEPL